MASKIILTVILSVIVSEALLQLFPLPDPYASELGRVHRFLPGWNTLADWFEKAPPFVVTFHTGPLIGVSTTSVMFKVNRYGFPYDELKTRRKFKEELRIGIIGGSTVECAALDQGKRWPEVLEKRLSAEGGIPNVTVFNLGVSDQDTRSHLATVAQHGVKLDLDYLVFMLGANDLFRTDSGDPLDRDNAFLHRERLPASLFVTKSQLVRRMRVIYHHLRGSEYHVSPKEDAPYFSTIATELQDLSILSTARKDISTDQLVDYEKNIVSLAALARAHNIVPIFMTQPMLWKPVMNPREEAVDWLAGTVFDNGRRYRVPSSEQARALELLNRDLLDTCAVHRFDCIDLEKEVPRSLEFLYDSIHLNEAGAERVAGRVAEFIIRNQKTRNALLRKAQG